MFLVQSFCNRLTTQLYALPLYIKSIVAFNMIEQFWREVDMCEGSGAATFLPDSAYDRRPQPSDRKPAREVTGKLTAGQFGQFGQYTNPMPFIPFPNNWQLNKII